MLAINKTFKKLVLINISNAKMYIKNPKVFFTYNLKVHLSKLKKKTQSYNAT